MKNTFTRHKVTIVIIAVILVLSVLASLYFLAWRPKDSDYQSALSSVKNIITAQSNIQTELDIAKYPGNLKSKNLTDLKSYLNDYTTAANELAKSTIITSDSAVKNTYQASIGNLDTYKQSVTDISTSLEQYMTTLYSCSGLYLKLDSLQTTAAFNSAARDCLDSVNNLDPPSKAFNDQFFTDYRTNVKSLVTAYGQKIAASTSKPAQASAQSSIDAATKALAVEKPAIDYKLVNLSKDLYSLYTTISTQQSKAFR